MRHPIWPGQTRRASPFSLLNLLKRHYIPGTDSGSSAGWRWILTGRFRDRGPAAGYLSAVQGTGRCTGGQVPFLLTHKRIKMVLPTRSISIYLTLICKFFPAGARSPPPCSSCVPKYPHRFLSGGRGRNRDTGQAGLPHTCKVAEKKAVKLLHGCRVAQLLFINMGSRRNIKRGGSCGCR